MSWRVPNLSELNPGVEPTEFMCLVAMAEKEAKTSGGIILPDATRSKEEWGSDHARLIAVSPLAFSYASWPEGARQPQPGDVVFVGKFPGEEIVGRDGRKYRLVSDKEILAVIERASSAQLEKAA